MQAVTAYRPIPQNKKLFVEKRKKDRGDGEVQMHSLRCYLNSLTVTHTTLVQVYTILHSNSLIIKIHLFDKN